MRGREILGAVLLTWHNLAYYQRLVGGLRAAITTGTLARFITCFHDARAA